jgi:hypothetical protein
VRSVDLAVYADALAAEAAAVAAHVERERGRLRLADIERAAARELPQPVVERLREHGLLRTRGDVEEVIRLEEALDALERLQAWVEARLRDRAAV